MKKVEELVVVLRIVTLGRSITQGVLTFKDDYYLKMFVYSW